MSSDQKPVQVITDAEKAEAIREGADAGMERADVNAIIKEAEEGAEAMEEALIEGAGLTPEQAVGEVRKVIGLS